jgi:hypothetical protein
MRTNHHRAASSRSGPRLPLPLLLVLSLAAPLVAQIQQGFKGAALKFPEYYETPLPGKNRSFPLKGLITGEQGRHLSNSLYLVTGMRMQHRELDGTTNLLARAPECLFDTDTHVAWSTGRLEIVGMGGALTIQGNQGFQVQMTNSTLIISNHVRTVIQRGLLNAPKP